MERVRSLIQRPRSSAEPKRPEAIGTIGEKAPPPRVVTRNGVTYTRIDEHTMEVEDRNGVRRVTIHGQGERVTQVALRRVSGSELGGDPRYEDPPEPPPAVPMPRSAPTELQKT